MAVQSLHYVGISVLTTAQCGAWPAVSAALPIAEPCYRVWWCAEPSRVWSLILPPGPPVSTCYVTYWQLQEHYIKTFSEAHLPGPLTLLMVDKGPTGAASFNQVCSGLHRRLLASQESRVVATFTVLLKTDHLPRPIFPQISAYMLAAINDLGQLASERRLQQRL